MRSIHVSRFCCSLSLLPVVGLTLSLTAHAARYGSVTVQNTAPRLDTAGNVIDAHDGCLQFFDGRYYLYGTAYGKTAGYTINNRFRVYSSGDLTHWRFDGELLKAPEDGVYYRPYVIYNARTKKYVLWFNWYRKLWDGQVGVAVSDSPTGPFTIANSNVQLTQAKDRPGDGSLFVDNDESAYFIYTTINQDHAIRIEKLSDDYLSSTGKVSESLGSDCEAPAMFRRNGLYYVLFDRTCCFCPQGSGARVLVADSPLGPYRQIANINRDAKGKPIIHAQQTYVARIPSAQGDQFIWMGDLWKSRPDGVKGHDLQYWSSPLKFASDGTILPLVPEDQWSMQIKLGSKQRPLRAAPYVWPQKKDPGAPRTDACYGTPLDEDGQPVSAEKDRK